MNFKIAANISLLFRELPLLERFEAARAAGFDGVEMQFPYGEAAADLSRAARDAGMPVVVINAPVTPQYPVGLAGRPEAREAFREQLSQMSEYSAALGVKRMHVLAGRIESNDERERCLGTFAENLKLAADALAPHGVVVLTEMLNSHDVPNYLIGTLADARTVLERCAGRAGLQFDFYHVARMELDLAAELERHLPLVRHVQFADAPGRHEPGTGVTAFEPALAVLRASGYQGWVSAEYIPRAATTAGLGWLQSWRRGG
jgi:hydroxypyruvate isomerase